MISIRIPAKRVVKVQYGASKKHLNMYTAPSLVFLNPCVSIYAAIKNFRTELPDSKSHSLNSTFQTRRHCVLYRILYILQIPLSSVRFPQCSKIPGGSSEALPQFMRRAWGNTQSPRTFTQSSSNPVFNIRCDKELPYRTSRLQITFAQLRLSNKSHWVLYRVV